MGYFSLRDAKQIAGTSKSLAVLCEDGTVWVFNEASWSWAQLPPVPGQPGTEESAGASANHDEMVLARQEQAQRAIRDRFESGSGDPEGAN